MNEHYLIKYGENKEISFTKSEIFKLAIATFSDEFENVFNKLMYHPKFLQLKINDTERNEIFDKVKDEVDKLIKSFPTDYIFKIGYFVKQINYYNKEFTSNFIKDISIQNLKDNKCIINVFDKSNDKLNNYILINENNSLIDKYSVTVLYGDDFENRYILDSENDIGDLCNIPSFPINNKEFKFILAVFLDDKNIHIKNSKVYNLKDADKVKQAYIHGKYYIDIAPYYDKEEKMLYIPITGTDIMARYGIPLDELREIITDISNDLSESKIISEIKEYDFEDIYIIFKKFSDEFYTINKSLDGKDIFVAFNPITVNGAQISLKIDEMNFLDIYKRESNIHFITRNIFKDTFNPISTCDKTKKPSDIDMPEFNSELIEELYEAIEVILKKLEEK